MAQDPTRSKKAAWIGWTLTALAGGMFLMSATMKVLAPPSVLQMFGHLGWQPGDLAPLAILEVTCALLYLIPPVSVLGAIVLTGFLGGAIATHVRVGEPVGMHVVIGLFIWGGLYLREPRLRALLPLRK
ncbi:MAG TPA: DoxX family protein [bacterium]|nr:DoxX family protein [bacterium]